jgi:hypothetical protein
MRMFLYQAHTFFMFGFRIVYKYMHSYLSSIEKDLDDTERLAKIFRILWIRNRWLTIVSQNKSRRAGKNERWEILNSKQIQNTKSKCSKCSVFNRGRKIVSN